MNNALEGSHYCKKHQGNHSHYAEHNCELCKAQTELAATKQKLEAAEAERKVDAESILHLLTTVKYLVGIAERGRGGHIDDTETAEQFVLRYVRQLKSTVATLKAERKELAEQEPEFRPLTGAGQIKAGYTVAFTSPEGLHKETVKQVLHAGTDKEEVIYNFAKNYYFITSMVLSGHSWPKDVTYAKPVPAPDLQKRIDELEAEVTRLSGASGFCIECERLSKENAALTKRVVELEAANNELHESNYAVVMESAQLTKKLAEQQASAKTIASLSERLAHMLHEWSDKANEITKIANGMVTGQYADVELTSLLSEARAEGVEEGKKLAVPVIEQAHMAGQYRGGAGVDPSAYDALVWIESTGKAMLAAAPTNKEE